MGRLWVVENVLHPTQGLVPFLAPEPNPSGWLYRAGFVWSTNAVDEITMPLSVVNGLEFHDISSCCSCLH